MVAEFVIPVKQVVKAAYTEMDGDQRCENFLGGGEPDAVTTAAIPAEVNPPPESFVMSWVVVVDIVAANGGKIVGSRQTRLSSPTTAAITSCLRPPRLPIIQLFGQNVVNFFKLDTGRWQPV